VIGDAAWVAALIVALLMALLSFVDLNFLRCLVATFSFQGEFTLMVRDVRCVVRWKSMVGKPVVSVSRLVSNRRV
jgi:hypothetical protein